MTFFLSNYSSYFECKSLNILHFYSIRYCYKSISFCMHEIQFFHLHAEAALQVYGGGVYGLNVFFSSI